MSGDSEQEYFSDGIVEDIITALCHVSNRCLSSHAIRVSLTRARSLKSSGSDMNWVSATCSKAVPERLTVRVASRVSWSTLSPVRIYGLKDLTGLWMISSSFKTRSPPAWLRQSCRVLNKPKSTHQHLNQPKILTLLTCTTVLSTLFAAFKREGNEDALRFAQQAISFDPNLLLRMALPWLAILSGWTKIG